MSNRLGTTRKTKHIELRFLFVQELILSGVIVVKKVLGTLSPADIMNKNVSKDTLQRHLSDAGILARHALSQPTYPDSSVHAIISSSRICSILLTSQTERDSLFDFDFLFVVCASSCVFTLNHSVIYCILSLQ
jgi:hypothetical protein